MTPLFIVRLPLPPSLLTLSLVKADSTLEIGTAFICLFYNFHHLLY
nr:hypothetical protein Q903MT_gene3317 [Picea sitchensis]